MKRDVASDLPHKTEQVLFCKLTSFQRRLYENYLMGPEVRGILEGKRNALAGIDGVRKICNHPDLLQRALHSNVDIENEDFETEDEMFGYEPSKLKKKTKSNGDYERSDRNRMFEWDYELKGGYGALERSGKMQVVKALLDMWKRQNHRVLLFCQTRQMQDILEKFVREQGIYYVI